jgi:hypothetical protein
LRQCAAVFGVAVQARFSLAYQPPVEFGHGGFRSGCKAVCPMASDAFAGGGAAEGLMAVVALRDVRVMAAQIAGRPERLGVFQGSPSQPREQQGGGDRHGSDGVAREWKKPHSKPAKIQGADDMGRRQRQEHHHHRRVDDLPNPEGLFARGQIIKPVLDILVGKPPAE